MTGRRLLIVGGLGVLACGSLAYAQRIFVGGGGGSGSGRALRPKPTSTGRSCTAAVFTGASAARRAARGGAPTIPARTTISPSGWPSSRASPSSSIPTASRSTSSSGSTTRCCTAVRCSSWKTSARSSSPSGGRQPPGLPAQGRIPVGRRLLGQLRLDAGGSNELARVLPPGEYPIFDIPISHPIMHTVYDVHGFPPGVRRSTSGTAAAGRSPSAAPTARKCTTAASRTRAAG